MPVGRLEFGDPVEQVDHDADARVVEAEPGPESFDPRDTGERTRTEVQLAGWVGVGVQQTKSHQPAYEVRMQAGAAREGVEGEPVVGPADAYLDESERHCDLPLESAWSE